MRIGAVTGIGFAGLGVFAAAAVSKIDHFSYIQSAVITPLFLVSGTFFPIDALPQGAQIASDVNPLYHCVQLVRHAVVFRLRIGRPGPRGDPALLRAGDVAWRCGDSRSA